MILLRALGGMAKAFAQRHQPPGRTFQCGGLVDQVLSVDARLAKQSLDLVQGKPRCLTQGDQRQPVDDIGWELTPLTWRGQ